MKIKATNIIDARNKISQNITKYWSIIRKENIISKNIKSASGSGIDLNILYNNILEMSKNRIKIKLYIQAINMGYKSISELKKNTNYVDIYTLNEKMEILVQLGKIDTIHPQHKARMGKNIKIKETFTAGKITNLKRKLEHEINVLLKNIEDFNNNAEIEIDDDLKSLFAA